MAGLRLFRSEGDTPGVRVFVAEDNAADVFWLEMVFKGARVSYTIELVQHGQQAQEYLESLTETSTWPDIIFLDVNLPGPSAEEILDSLTDKKVIPLFMISGVDVPIALRKRIGEDRCLLKPMTNAQLLACFEIAGLSYLFEEQSAA